MIRKLLLSGIRRLLALHYEDRCAFAFCQSSKPIERPWLRK